MKRRDAEFRQYPNLVGTYEKPRRVPKNLSWVRPGFGVTLASHETSKHPRRWSMRPDRVQIEPAGVTAEQSISEPQALLTMVLRDYKPPTATHATNGSYVQTPQNGRFTTG